MYMVKHYICIQKCHCEQKSLVYLNNLFDLSKVCKYL